MHARWVTRQLAAVGPGEDRLGVWLGDATLVIALADGAGGIPGGARAADLAVSGLLRSLPGDPVTALKTLDARIHDDREAGECTAIALSFTQGIVRGASCGDSAAFLDGVELTTGQHRKRRLGSGRALPTTFEGRGRRLLGCSDGLSGYVRGAKLEAALALPRLDAAADALVASARLPSGGLMDDLALVLVDLES